jgi:sugar lactone lactonase YvrE
VKAEPVTDLVSDLGEAPLWSPAEARLYFADISGRTIHRLDPETGRTETFTTTGMPAGLALHRAGSLLVAWRAGLSLLDLASGAETPIANDIDFAEQRFNDGKTDRRGRFFAGTMHRRMQEPVGGLYRIDADRTVSRIADGIRLSNGIAWSPDDRVLYHCDSRPGLVLAWDYDIATGGIANRRVFLDLSQMPYRPDGCTIDAEGCLWLAEVGNGTVGRYAPDGRRVGGVDVPGARRVTSVAFGGADLGTLFITSLRYGIADEDLAMQPLAGRLFAVRPGVRGLPETPYAG